MSSSSDDTILPAARRPINSGGLVGDTVLPPQNAAAIHFPGDVIDNRYTVIREIGRGGMGVVYEVNDDFAGIRVAVKRLLPDLVQRTDLSEVFKREGLNAMRFTAESPRFVTLRHLGADTNGLYLVMDFIKDTTLRGLLESQTNHRLDLEFACKVMQDLARSLSDLHQLGFVHRDLKPENIFVQLLSDQVRVRLVDFGLTKDEAEGTRTSIRGAGTSGYASPEQRKGLPTTPATDIYAFGVIAYEMLTGELPSMGDSITDYVSDVPQNLVDIIVQCQGTRPERRPQDGLTLITLLTADQPVIVQDSQRAETPPPSRVAVPIVHTGTLILNGVPNGAQIFLDGSQVDGMQHKLVLRGNSQQVELLVRCDGFEDYFQKVLLVSSAVTDESVQMKQSVAIAKHRHARFPELMRYVDAMCHIPAGTFQMGSIGLFAPTDEKPAHNVFVSDYYLGATPVTVSMWKEYCNSTGISYPPAPSWGLLDDHPIVNVSWDDIMGVDGRGGYCLWASEIAGARLGLPTEAQWENAVRSGMTGHKFPWGNEMDHGKLWSSLQTHQKYTVPVNRNHHVHQNVYGVSDMVGNVWEWCFDMCGPYESSPQTNPVGPLATPENKRSVRGGSFYDGNPDFFRCAYRFRYHPNYLNFYVGFRLAAGQS